MVIGSLLSNQLEPENAAHRKQKVAAIAKKKHVVKHKQKTAATHNKKMATIQKQMDVRKWNGKPTFFHLPRKLRDKSTAMWP